MRFEESQRGSARVKLVGTILIMFVIGNALYNYIPAIYNAENLRTEMHAAVMQGMSLPPTAGKPVDVTKKRILGVMQANNVPSYAYLEVKQANNIIQARVAYTQPIPILPFGLYDYDYQFDHTTRTGNYLAKE